MDLQAMYEDLQTKIKDNVDKIETKQKEISNIKNEISALDADTLRLQGAVEMLVIVSKGLEEQKPNETKEDTIINEQEEITEIE